MIISPIRNLFWGFNFRIEARLIRKLLSVENIFRIALCRSSSAGHHRPTYARRSLLTPCPALAAQKSGGSALCLLGTPLHLRSLHQSYGATPVRRNPCGSTTVTVMVVVTAVAVVVLPESSGVKVHEGRRRQVLVVVLLAHAGRCSCRLGTPTCAESANWLGVARSRLYLPPDSATRLPNLLDACALPSTTPPLHCSGHAGSASSKRACAAAVCTDYFSVPVRPSMTLRPM